MSEQASEYILNVVELLNVTKQPGTSYNENIRGILNWRDVYDSNKTYYINDIVLFNELQYIRINETPGNETPTNIISWTFFATTKKNTSAYFTFRDNNNRPYIDTNNVNYLLGQKILYPGSESVGNPSSIQVIASITGNGSANIRIIDVTNANIICENTNINTTEPNIFNLGVLSNIPTSISDLEIQYNRGTANLIRLYCLTMIF